MDCEQIFIEPQHARKNSHLHLTFMFMCRCLSQQLTAALFPLLSASPPKNWQMAVSLCPRWSVLAYWSLALIFAVCSSPSSSSCNYKFHSESFTPPKWIFSFAEHWIETLSGRSTSVQSSFCKSWCFFFLLFYGYRFLTSLTLCPCLCRKPWSVFFPVFFCDYPLTGKKSFKRLTNLVLKK